MKSVALALLLSVASCAKIQSFSLSDASEELYLPEVFEMKEENPFEIDTEYLQTTSNLRLSTGFKTMMMAAMDLKWVELPDCKDKGQGGGDQIQLVFSEGGQPENGTVATCKPRIKNNEQQPIWE